MKVIGLGKHTAHIFGDILKLDLLIVGHGLLLKLCLVKVIESFLSILKDDLGLLLDLSLKT